MRTAVFDANIFIDLLHAELFLVFLKLSYSKYAPPDIIGEVQEADRNMLLEAIDSGKIIVPVIEDLASIVECQQQKCLIHLIRPFIKNIHAKACITEEGHIIYARIYFGIYSSLRKIAAVINLKPLNVTRYRLERGILAIRR